MHKAELTGPYIFVIITEGDNCHIGVNLCISKHVCIQKVTALHKRILSNQKMGAVLVLQNSKDVKRSSKLKGLITRFIESEKREEIWGFRIFHRCFISNSIPP